MLYQIAGIWYFIIMGKYSMKTKPSGESAVSKGGSKPMHAIDGARMAQALPKVRTPHFKYYLALAVSLIKGGGYWF